LRYGTCTNYGLCARADTREAQTTAQGAAFECQECKRPLTPIRGSGSNGLSLLSLPVILGVFLLIALIGGVYYFAAIRHSDPSPVTSFAPPVVNSAPPPLLRLCGSNTIGAQLAPALAEAWLAQRGINNVHRAASGPDQTRVSGMNNRTPVSIDIQAHGSATAFTGLADGTCDIGMASRKIKPQEAADLASRGLGDLTANAEERVIGLDGVAVIVNEANSVDSMTIPEVAAVFSGSSKGKTWVIYARDDKSGTYDTFKDRVLGSLKLSSNAKRFEDSRALVSAVAQDRDGIGFVGLPYASGAKVLAISEQGAIPLVPNPNTVKTESYALSRRLYFYLPNNAKPEAREFTRFAISDDGQAIVEKSGFVGQTVGLMSNQKAPERAPAAYAQIMPSADRLTVDFRFRPGSSQLDTKAVDDIKRVAATMSKEYAGRGVMLIGFADSTGAAAANRKLSKDRAQAVAEQMERQGITPAFITGFGPELPVASNDTPEGREKNRRVEVWLRK
jgi:phosphate transport system substrate-binding protein